MQQYDTNPQPVTTPPQPLNPNLTFALPAIRVSDRHFNSIIEYDLNYTESALLLDFLGNMEAETGFIHKRTVAEFTKRHGVKPSNFYGKKGYKDRFSNPYYEIFIAVSQNTKHTRHNPRVQRRVNRRPCLRGVHGTPIHGTQTPQTMHQDQKPE